jgi:hypothetical protein
MKKLFIVGTLIGYETALAFNAKAAWSVVNTSDNNLDKIVAFNKKELQKYLLNKGYKSIKPTEYKNVYLIA